MGSRPSSLHVLANDPAPTVPPVVFRVGEDIVNRTAVYEFENLLLFGNRGSSRSHWTTCANATIDAEATYVCKYGTENSSYARFVARTARLIRFGTRTEIAITVNGEKYWAKSWSTEVTRRLF